MPPVLKLDDGISLIVVFAHRSMRVVLSTRNWVHALWRRNCRRCNAYDVCIKGKCMVNTIQYNTIQYNTIQYNTIQYNTIQYNTIQYNTIQYNTFNKESNWFFIVFLSNCFHGKGVKRGSVLDDKHFRYKTTKFCT